jgi:hypothetical protein
MSCPDIISHFGAFDFEIAFEAFLGAAAAIIVFGGGK